MDSRNKLTAKAKGKRAKAKGHFKLVQDSSGKSGPTLKRKRSSASCTMSVAAKRSPDVTSASRNTLSMISTPWSTESGYTLPTLNTTLSEASLSWTYADIFSFSSGYPQTTTASSGHYVSNTVSLLYSASIPEDSFKLSVPSVQVQTPKPSIQTLETFGSSLRKTLGQESDKSNVFKAKPWSPMLCSGTDFYPSSLDTLASRKGSRACVTSRTSSKREEEYFPMNYLAFHPDFVQHQASDWTLVKQHGIPYVISVPM